MSRFTSTNTEVISLGKNEKGLEENINVKTELSFKDVLEIQGSDTTNELELLIKFISVMVTEWKLYDNNDQVPEITRENIELLDIETVTQITNILGKKFRKIVGNKKKLEKDISN